MGALDALSPLVGTWDTTITLLYPEEQRGQTCKTKDSYRWLPGKNVLVHDVDGEMDGERINSIEIYTPLADGKANARSFASSGDATDYTAEMLDGSWLITGSDHRFASTLVSKNVIEGKWQLKVSGQWRDWMTVSLARVHEG